jgi:hypothetical protein
MPSTAKSALPFIKDQTLVKAQIERKGPANSDCYETKGDKQMKAMFRFSEHRFLSLVKA